VELKSIILSSGFEIIASKCPESQKEKKAMAVSKKRTSLEYWYKHVLPNLVVKVNGQRIYSELQ